jgi:hypothetical protein
MSPTEAAKTVEAEGMPGSMGMGREAMRRVEIARQTE